MIVRNDAGVEGLVAWHKIQARRDAPVRLSYGYAMTVDTAQGSTATEHIHALPAGSHAIHGFKAYTAASRHQRTTWIVVDEASERRHLASRSMLGPETGNPRAGCVAPNRRKSQPPATEGQRARYIASDGADAASRTAAERTTGPIRQMNIGNAEQYREPRAGRLLKVVAALLLGLEWSVSSETKTEEHPSNGQGRGLIEYLASLG